ncbi:mitochondrial ribosomal protein subunit L20-domain-containing protein [Phycomyces nitens]|nr:mitochondrial ribosomal protein subunit L20-domain-containing protein [Phycomyces nitens]
MFSRSLVVRPFVSVRAYATKSKTTNLKMTSRLPIQESHLADGSVFVTRQPPVSPAVQSTAPVLKKSVTESKVLSESEKEEMRQLRTQDPERWTRKRLAEKFGCSELFVGINAPTTKRTVSVEEEPTKEYGYRRQLIRKNREKRKELW